MILTICPYQILKNKQCSHFLKTSLSIVNWLILRVRIHVKRKIILFNLQCYQYNDDISLCSVFLVFNNIYIRYRINSTQMYTYLCEECVCLVTTFTFSNLRQSHSNQSKNKTPIH